MLISDLINVRYLSGFSGSNGALLVFADERDAVLATDDTIFISGCLTDHSSISPPTAAGWR